MSSPMLHDFRVVRRVEFSDTDMAGLMHFSNYFRFMETAEHAFYRELGFSVVLRDRRPALGFPRVHASCDFTKPLRFEDLVEIRLRVTAKKSKSLTYSFQFWNMSADPVVEAARGVVTIVCVSHSPDGKLAAVPIPDDIAGKIAVAPETIAASKSLSSR